MSLGAVLFDMDGTLVDSEKLWTVALNELAARLGGVLSPAGRARMVGTSMAESMQILYADLAVAAVDPPADVAWLEDRVADLFAAGLPWRPGAGELLAAVRDAGVPTALVTSTRRRLVEIALDSIGPANFDTVVCGDDLAETKPHPLPYTTAAARLGVTPAVSVAIEDSPTGVASALAAGCAVLAVPSEAAFGVAGATMAPSLSGVDVGYLATLVAPAAA